MQANDQARQLPQLAAAPLPQAFRAEAVSLYHSDGRPLLRDLQLELQPGQALLVKGPSGAGKTTLLRALAGLWPYVEGQLQRPTGNQALFLSQWPYLPLGDLASAIAYPAYYQSEQRSRLVQLLDQLQLGHLRDQLDVQADWSRILSIGEQQRLAFARVLLNQPQMVFLDESTSAMDEDLEDVIYQLLRSELPDCILFSVGHRNTLDRFHSYALALDGKGGWSFAAMAQA